MAALAPQDDDSNAHDNAHDNAHNAHNAHNVDVLEMNEAFEDVDGRFTFPGTLVVFQADGKLYHGVSTARYSSSANVMLDSDGSVGDSLDGVGRTYKWYDNKV